MRVVFDTNVLVAALAFPGGRGEAALRRATEGIDELLLSRPMLDELLGVLARKFARDAEELARVAVFLGEVTTMLVPRRRLRVVTGEADNRIVECAQAGKAHAIVTGDRALLALKRHGGVRILSLADYLADQ